MSSAPIRIDTQGTVTRAVAQLDQAPAAVKRAETRALRKLGTWLKRQVLRTVSKSVGTTQKALTTALRYQARAEGGDYVIWIGTNPIKAQYLGKVTWKRSMPGAKVGRRLFPGTWSWNRGKTGAAVMQRHSDNPADISEVRVEIHDTIDAAVQALVPLVSERFERLMLQELNYALRLEGRAA